ncbi:hypothetical protein D3C76_795560 [compost metagenome]
MSLTDTADVVVRNAPPVAVAGASVTDWFAGLPMSNIVQVATLVWILIQAGFYIYDRVRKNRNGRKQ